MDDIQPDDTIGILIREAVSLLDHNQIWIKPTSYFKIGDTIINASHYNQELAEWNITPHSIDDKPLQVIFYQPDTVQFLLDNQRNVLLQPLINQNACIQTYSNNSRRKYVKGHDTVHCYSNTCTNRWEFRSSNHADIVELELDIKSPAQDLHGFTLSIKVGILSVFEFLSDKILISNQ